MDAAAALTPSHASSTTLERLPRGASARVVCVKAPAQQAEWADQLSDLGFVSGEQVAVIAQGMPGADPLVVRVGLSTYALRRAEAACVHVTPTGKLSLG